MDLYAYSKIEDLDSLAIENGINVPRLRGYRLMSEEEACSDEEIEKIARGNYREIRRLDTPKKNWIPLNSHFQPYDKRQAKGEGRASYKRTVKQLRTFNKYVGQKDVLMIHARIGGPNWVDYGGSMLTMEKWFIEKVDDGFDNTYCDIYARIQTDKE